MVRAVFEIECERPEIVRDAVMPDDTHPVKFRTGQKMLVMEIEAASVKHLMKIAYSTCNRIQLSIETVDMFGAGK
jgi:hypothetical protein